MQKKMHRFGVTALKKKKRHLTFIKYYIQDVKLTLFPVYSYMELKKRNDCNMPRNIMLTIT